MESSMESVKTSVDYCFCTLALGENYCSLAMQLAGNIKQFSPGVALLVLTDYPDKFRGLENVIAVYHKKRSVRGFNDKLCVINTALASFNTCIFIDADVRILKPIHLAPEIFEPGIRTYNLESWKDNIEEALSGEMSPWKENDIRIIKLFRRKLGLKQPDEDIPFVVEFLFAVTKCDGIDAFLHKWNELAELCERNMCFYHEGFSIGLAAMLTNYPCYEHKFAGLKFFEPQISLRDHLHGEGSMSQEEYDELNNAMGFLKFGEKAGPIENVVGKITRRLSGGYRFLKIKLFGLDLLSK